MRPSSQDELGGAKRSKPNESRDAEQRFGPSWRPRPEVEPLGGKINRPRGSKGRRLIAGGELGWLVGRTARRFISAGQLAALSSGSVALVTRTWCQHAASDCMAAAALPLSACFQR